jgi:hypothetical protein
MIRGDTKSYNKKCLKCGEKTETIGDITYKETKGKRLIGHTKNYDVYEDTEGNTYNYWGTK